MRPVARLFFVFLSSLVITAGAIEDATCLLQFSPQLHRRAYVSPGAKQLVSDRHGASFTGNANETLRFHSALGMQTAKVTAHEEVTVHPVFLAAIVVSSIGVCLLFNCYGGCGAILHAFMWCLAFPAPVLTRGSNDALVKNYELEDYKKIDNWKEVKTEEGRTFKIGTMYQALEMEDKNGDLRKIATVYVRFKEDDGVTSGRKTMLYSHGNHTDLGHLHETGQLHDLARDSGADIFAYDYCGYGLSEGCRSEDNCYLCIDRAYRYLTEDPLGPHISSRSIVVMGRSLGTAPSIDFVSKNRDVGALILMSPLLSALSTVHCCTVQCYGRRLKNCFHQLDFFKSYQKLDKIKGVDTLLIHGTRDWIILFEHGQAIHEKLKQVSPDNIHEFLPIEGAGHTDKEMPREQWVGAVQAFIGRTQACMARTSEDRRIDPDDGMAYTLADFTVKCEGVYSKDEAESYFLNHCAPAASAETNDTKAAQG